jgi:hypothetical protein
MRFTRTWRNAGQRQLCVKQHVRGAVFEKGSNLRKVYIGLQALCHCRGHPQVLVVHVAAHFVVKSVVQQREIATSVQQIVDVPHCASACGEVVVHLPVHSLNRIVGSTT